MDLKMLPAAVLGLALGLFFMVALSITEAIDRVLGRRGE